MQVPWSGPGVTGEDGTAWVTAWARMKPERSLGADGIPSDVWRHLPATINEITMLFSLMLRYAIYPQGWGIAMVRSLLKPGKPPEQPSNLRGIRLINSIAAWFGQLIDGRARKQWQAGDEQFGFREGIGCLEAVMTLLALVYSRIYHRRRLFVVWIDLRTAFPSLNRAILIRRIFECGFTIGFCRLILAIYDTTVSVLHNGRLVSQGFRETRGTCEGAVEPPHFFNMYISGLQDKIERESPNVCVLMGVAIAIILYADDAAIPANSLEDLQNACRVLEAICNEHQLSIATAKTFLTVFHHEDDRGVVYETGTVTVDRVLAVILIYAEQISAAQCFKYLVVVISSTGTHQEHTANRLTAFRRAIGKFKTSIRCIPDGSFAFVKFVWKMLVFPVPAYGMEVYVWDELDCKEFQQMHMCAWRSLLQIGGRTPAVAIETVTGMNSCTLNWRARRVALFFRMVNAPAGSWPQIALITMSFLSTPWFHRTLADLQLVLPGAVPHVGHDFGGPFLFTSGRWSDAGEWLSAHPYSTNHNLAGQRRRLTNTREDRTKIKNHIARITGQLRARLRREQEAKNLETMLQRQAENPYSKTSLMVKRLCRPGPPMTMALERVGPKLHRSAMAALLGGDLFFGVHAGIFSAKDLSPNRTITSPMRSRLPSTSAGSACHVSIGAGSFASKMKATPSSNALSTRRNAPT